MNTPESAIVEYDQGKPRYRGVYACRIPAEGFREKFLDKFLFWSGNEWSYLGSDQLFRDNVPYWIGPLRRIMGDAK